MKFIPAGLANKIGRSVLTMKKDSPKLLFVAGVVGVIGTTILACRSTLKLEKTLEDFQNNVDAVKEKNAALPSNESESKIDKQMVRVYANGSYELVKLYAPAIILGVVSIGALTGSHVTLTRRNTALMAAYSAVSTSFEAYRERVRKELGEEKELDVYHAVQLHKVSDDPKAELVRIADPNNWSPYARFFDEYNRNWEKTPEYNRIFIQSKQNYLNHLLQARGHVFLNEAYDELGMDRSKAGQVVGWVIGPDGDNYIDFGIFKAVNSNFVSGWERSIILDFNVDGVIYDKF